MSDTQWPRFYVFKQDAADQPHLDCGTLHAPDAEMALLNARDVFVRRPECASLWVIAADKVHARTQESIQADPPAVPAEDGSRLTYAVFLKHEWRKQQAFAGEVRADTAQAALAKAASEHADSKPLEIWVAPVNAMRASSEEQVPAWFAPAQDKPYRHGAFYHTDTLMRKIMQGGDES